MAEAASKNPRIRRSPSPAYKLDDEDDSYRPYVSVSQRQQEKRAKLLSLGASSVQLKVKRLQEEGTDAKDDQNDEDARREKARKEKTLLVEAQEVHRRKALEGTSPRLSLDVYSCSDAKKTDGEKAEEANAEILEAIRSRRKLASDMELAKGIQYTEPLKTR